MKNIIAISFLLSVACSCKEYKFSKKHGYISDRKIKTIYYGNHKDSYSAWDFGGFPLSYGGGTSYDSVINYHKMKAMDGPAVDYFKSVVFRNGTNSEWVNFYNITDYVRGRDIGNRFFAYIGDQLVEFGYDYPSKRIRIQFDSLSNPINLELYDAYKNIDAFYPTNDSIHLNVDSLRQELIKPNWFKNHFKMTYMDSINGLSPLIETNPTKK